jgi:hypothetical protein
VIAEVRRRAEAVAWLAALLPLVAGHAAYLISAAQELVPWCVPHLQGCTSVSKAARAGEANVLFKALMLPYCAFAAWFWWLAAQWLRETLPGHPRTQRLLFPLGLVAALATALYTAALGVDGEFYQFMRRYGINMSFAFTVLNELLITNALARDTRVPRLLREGMVGMCGALLLMGLAAVPMQYFMGSRSPALNAVEWTYALMMLVFYPLIGAAWRRTGWTGPLATARAPA